jgi:hypothetical protein
LGPSVFGRGAKACEEVGPVFGSEDAVAVVEASVVAGALGAVDVAVDVAVDSTGAGGRGLGDWPHPASATNARGAMSDESMRGAREFERDDCMVFTKIRVSF